MAKSNPSKWVGNERKYLEAVLNSRSWSSTSGNWTQTLERAFASKVGTKYAVCFNSGTSTLHAAIEAAGVLPGDEVISPALTVIMNSTATFHANAVPVYADVNPRTFNIDPIDVRKKITPKTKAIICVGLYGLPPELLTLKEIAKEYNIVLIEDNAQCFGSLYDKRMTGTFGQMASFSFENTKHLSCGEGGAITTNSEYYAEKVRKIGGHGFKNLKAEEGRVRLNADLFQHPDYKRHDCLGWNYRMTEFSAAIALAQLERIEELIDLRIKSAEFFIDVMNDTNFLIPQFIPSHCTNTYYTLGVLYNGKEEIGVSWQDFRKTYVEEGGDGIYGAWSVPYLEPFIVERKYIGRCPWVYKNIRYKKGLCPVAEEVQGKLMQFKTNYRDLELAKYKASVLKKTIKKLSK